MKRLACVVGLGLVAVAGSASASPDNVAGIAETTPGIAPEGALAPMSIVEGPGIKVGEGTVLHPILGLETGFVSNVFYEGANESPRGAGILRLVGQIGTGSLSPQRLQPGTEADAMPVGQQNDGTFEYRADLRLSYDFYLSGDSKVTSQGGLGVGALFRGSVFPQRTWSFLYLDYFQRLVRSTNFESSKETTRDINRLELGLKYAPIGRTISGLLHYDNVIDLFEDANQQFSNRLQNTLGATVSWRFRPVTTFFVDTSLGFYSGLGADSTKVSSMPLTAAVGAQTLLTLNTSIVARVGYTNGFYNSGPSYSAVVGGLQFGYRYSRTGRVTAMYDYNHQDSINANFFRDHVFQVQLEQQFVPFVLNVTPEIRLRQYQGVSQVISSPGTDTRNDVIFSIAAGARYNFRDWFAGVVEYRLSSVQTDFKYMSGGLVDDPSYTRHEIVAGVRAAL